MRSGVGILKSHHLGGAKIMDESSTAASTMAASKATGATTGGTIRGAYKTARENRAATLAAAEALASFPMSAAASISTPSGSREQPMSTGDARMMTPNRSGIKPTTVASAKKKAVKYVKDPRAPKRFKSAFIFFTMHRHKTIRKEIEEKEGGPGTGERVSRIHACGAIRTFQEDTENHHNLTYLL
jgi:hypothetical protein